MDYSFRKVMEAMKRFVKVNDVSGSIFAATTFDQMMNQTEEFEAKIMEWAKEHPEPKKKTWGEVLFELGILDIDYIIAPLPTIRQGTDDVFYSLKPAELRKHVPDEILKVIEDYLKK